jgi:hypothetical protein
MNQSSRERRELLHQLVVNDTPNSINLCNKNSFDRDQLDLLILSAASHSSVVHARPLTLSRLFDSPVISSTSHIPISTFVLRRNNVVDRKEGTGNQQVIDGS